MLNAKAVEAVNRGVEFLNKNSPGWRSKINADTLYISSHNSCILGQLFGDYGKGIDALNLECFDQRVEYGFTHPWDNTVQFPELDDAWKAELNKPQVRRIRIVVTPKDMENHFGNIYNCPVATAIKRIVKKGLRVSAGSHSFSIEGIVYETGDFYRKICDGQKKTLGERKAFHLYATVPVKYLKKG